MVFRKTEEKDCPQVIALYQQAQSYFKEAGIDQWQNGYPNAETLAEDMAGGESYVLVDKETGEVLGTCFVSFEKEPDYDVIYEGSWLNDEPYGVIHRIAVASHRRGVASFCYEFALSQCPNLRIDTHRDNVPMQRSLQKNGVHRCGIIHLQNGDPRIAFHKHNQ